METDLDTASSPIEAIAILRNAANKYRESAGMLASEWQDQQAGKIWLDLATGLEKLADKTEKAWNKL